MGEARAEITIDRSADDVWATVGNFGDLMWMPGVETLRARRRRPRPRMFGMRIVERQYSRDDEAAHAHLRDRRRRHEAGGAPGDDHGDAGGQRIVRHVGRRDRRRHGRGDAGRLHRRARRAQGAARGLSRPSPVHARARPARASRGRAARRTTGSPWRGTSRRRSPTASAVAYAAADHRDHRAPGARRAGSRRSTARTSSPSTPMRRSSSRYSATSAVLVRAPVVDVRTLVARK